MERWNAFHAAWRGWLLTRARICFSKFFAYAKPLRLPDEERRRRLHPLCDLREFHRCSTHLVWRLPCWPRGLTPRGRGLGVDPRFCFGAFFAPFTSWLRASKAPARRGLALYVPPFKGGRGV